MLLVTEVRAAMLLVFEGLDMEEAFVPLMFERRLLSDAVWRCFRAA